LAGGEQTLLTLVKALRLGVRRSRPKSLRNLNAATPLTSVADSPMLANRVRGSMSGSGRQEAFGDADPPTWRGDCAMGKSNYALSAPESIRAAARRAAKCAARRLETRAPSAVTGSCPTITALPATEFTVSI
jgi:hypothetical protein